MNKNSNPIDFLIDFAWANGADRFVVNNAKDELKKLKAELHCVAWARINDRGDLFDIRQNKNTYIQNLVPLFIREKDVQQTLSSFNSKSES
jgi:hypothetical protein